LLMAGFAVVKWCQHFFIFVTDVHGRARTHTDYHGLRPIVFLAGLGVLARSSNVFHRALCAAIRHFLGFWVKDFRIFRFFV